MNRKFLSALLAVVLVLSLSAPALAAGFKDLEGHWAKEYMEDLAERKYLSGYEDGTMRPNASITAAETLALLSRFYSPTTAETALITDDYGDVAEAAAGTTLSWAQDEFALCLAAGIVTKTELKAMELTKPIEKQRFALLLVRAMQKQSAAAALAQTKLTFADAAAVSSDCVGSVAELVELKILTGDDTNKLLPASGVTRGVVATMISRSLDYLDDNAIKLSLTAYNGLSRTSGIIVEAGSGSIELRGTDSLVREYKFTTAAAVTVNGTAKTLSSTYVGKNAVISMQNGAVTAIAVTDSSDESWAQGRVTGISVSTSGIYISVLDIISSKLLNFTIPGTNTIEQDGKQVLATAVTKNDFVTIKTEKGVLSEVYASAADCELKGEITELKFASQVQMKVMDASGVSYVFEFDIASPPQILRGKNEIGVDRLSVGTKVVMGVTDTELKKISAEGTEYNATGVLTSITSTTEGTQWVIKTDNGTLTLSLDKNVGVYSGKTAIRLVDVQAGDTVNVLYYGTTVTEAYLISSTNSSTKLTGTVLAVNTSGEIVTVLTSSQKIVYVDLDAVSSILVVVTGKTISLSRLTKDSQIVAYGAYSNATSFAAKTFLVEALA